MPCLRCKNSNGALFLPILIGPFMFHRDDPEPTDKDAECEGSTLMDLCVNVQCVKQQLLIRRNKHPLSAPGCKCPH